MKITDVRVHLCREEKLKAFATVTFDDCFVVRNVKIISGYKGLLVCMPSRRADDGSYKDVAHPITAEFRKVMEDAVLGCYERELEKGQDSASPSEPASR